MYLRVVRAAGGKGVKHEYVRIVEAYRENGKNKHRTVMNLGRKDLLAAHLDFDKLNQLLHGEGQTTEIAGFGRELFAIWLTFSGNRHAPMRLVFGRKAFRTID
jgi:hypothetical protein